MNQEQKFKKLPYGISDFGTLRGQNRYYIDKTRFIHDIEDKGNFLFFIRPRRFGKSLFLSVLEYYYDMAQVSAFDSIFSDTYIHQNPTPEKNNYMVLKLDFSAVKSETHIVETAFTHHIADMLLNVFLVKYEPLLGKDVNDLKKRLESCNDASIIMGTFLNYMRVKQQKLYIIIDEYDNFANTIVAANGQVEYQRITHGQGFFRSFFNVLKSGTSGSNAPITRLFMTGVSPITLDDVTSGFNITTNISLYPDLNAMLGFTRSEVESLIHYYRQTGKIHHTTEELIQLMSYWYNHYRFSIEAEQEVFNSVQVLYFLRQYLEFQKIPQSLIDDNVLIDYNKLRHLIILDQEGKTTANGNFSMLKEIIESGLIHSPIKNRFPLAQLSDSENFASLLYYFGLLTIAGSDEENNAILTIPNETIKRLYYDYIKETYEETGIFSLNLKQYSALMHGMAFKGEWQPLLHYLAQCMADAINLRDLMTGERVIQAFLNVYLGLSNLYILHSERETNKGFAYLTLEPFLMQYPGLKYAYLLELKYLKVPSTQPETSPELIHKIETLRLEAENQLHQYALDEKLKKTIGKTQLIKLVLIFGGFRLLYCGEAQENNKKYNKYCE